MILTAALIVLILWLLGFTIHIGGGFIHLLLIIGLILLIAHFLGGGRRTVV
jgi:hypothetical protein